MFSELNLKSTLKQIKNILRWKGDEKGEQEKDRREKMLRIRGKVLIKRNSFRQYKKD